MKSTGNFYIFLIISFITIFIPGCVIKRSPKVTTAPITSIEPTSAIGGGIVTSDGNADMKVRGVCWDTRKSPDEKDSRTTDGYEVGEFSSNISGLLPNTLYYVRAYAINTEGTGYGNQVTFTTGGLGIPTLTTTSVTAVTQTTAVSGGNVTTDGGSLVTEKGVCWAITTGPTISNNKTSNGTGTGIFTSNITGLTGNTRYYVRAFATNAEGTGYGQEVSFISGPVIPTLTTSDPSATSTTTGTGGGTVSNEGGSPVTARGVCWGLTANPTISGSKTTDGSGTGTFVSSITGLTANTTYHVRAYATNIAGTAYGTDKTFSTDPVTVNDADGNSYHVIRIGTQLWLKENLETTSLNDGTDIALVTSGTSWSNLSTPAYCLYSNLVSNKDIYGALYNWYTVNTGKLCPTGWRVSTDEDWNILENHLGGASPAGGKLKETGFAHWANPNYGATNESGFTALPGGYRLETGTFESITLYGSWWTSTEISPNAFRRRIWYQDDKTFRDLVNAKYGMSVRCIKN